MIDELSPFPVHDLLYALFYSWLSELLSNHFLLVAPSKLLFSLSTSLRWELHWYFRIIGPNSRMQLIGPFNGFELPSISRPMGTPTHKRLVS